MPIKWKIFFILNVLVALLALVFLIATIATISEASHKTGSIIYSIFFIGAFTVMVLNGFLNIFLLQRFYPDKPVPAAAKSLSLLCLIFTGLLILFVLLVLVVVIFSEKADNISGKIAFAISFLATIMQIVVLVMQGQLPLVIQRNNENKMHSLINSIGQSPEEGN